MENTINYEAIKNDMNGFYDRNKELFVGCSEQEEKAICMMFAAMKQGIEAAEEN